MALAGGLAVGDRVVCRGLPGTVVGGPARAACNRLSVAVRYDDGRIADERVVNLELLVDDYDDEDDQQEEEMPPQMQQLDAGEDEEQSAQDEQQMASQAMWAEAPQQKASPAFEPQTILQPAEEAESPDSRYEDNGRDAPPGEAAGFGADQAEAALRAKIDQNYEDLRDAFRALDQSNNGYVTREDFFQAMGNVFLGNGFSEDDVYEVADRFDLNKDGYISFNEFVAIVEGDDAQQEQAADAPAYEEAYEEDPRVVTAVELAIQKLKCCVDQRYSSIRKAFLAFDMDRRGSLAPASFAKGLINHGVFLSPPELELAWSIFDRDGDDSISYTEFCEVMTQRLQFGSHLNRQMFM